ncbi:MAG: hypothetical protein AAGJ94_00225 [Pseudomonadota bacterium]
MTFVVIAVFWCIFLYSFVAPIHRIVYLIMCSICFGTFSTIPTSVTGFVFLPAPLFALALVMRVALAPNAPQFIITSVLVPRRMLLLFLFLVVAYITTLFMPRLFAGGIDVVTFRGRVDTTVPLRPTPQNLSQLFYVTISVFSVVAFAFILRKPVMRQHALKAVWWGGVFTVATGVLDYLNSFLPLDPLLAPFRTASYALATDVALLGGKRVVGLTSEASAFGNICIAFALTLYFFRRAIDDQRLRDVWAPILIVMLVGMVWLSKSTGAYVILCIAFALAGLDWLLRAARGRKRSRVTTGIGTEFWLAFGGVMSVLLVLLTNPAVFEPIYALFERLVLNKAESTSFEERGMWRLTAWTAFLDSSLFGVGVGSTRASSAVVSTFASTGLIGALFYYGFLLQTALRKAPPGSVDGPIIVVGFRWWIIPGLFVGLFVGTVDFGIFNAFVLGLVTAVGTTRMAQPLRAEGITPRSRLPASRPS